MWLNSCGWFDGEKHVCMDYLKQAIDKNECLIYSFGLGSDWTFENTMANMGCTIRALGTLPPKILSLAAYFTSLTTLILSNVRGAIKKPKILLVKYS